MIESSHIVEHTEHSVTTVRLGAKRPLPLGNHRTTWALHIASLTGTRGILSTALHLTSTETPPEVFVVLRNSGISDELRMVSSLEYQDLEVRESLIGCALLTRRPGQCTSRSYPSSAD